MIFFVAVDVLTIVAAGSDVPHGAGVFESEWSDMHRGYLGVFGAPRTRPQRRENWAQNSSNGNFRAMRGRSVHPA